MAVANEVIHAKAKALAWDDPGRPSAYPSRYVIPASTRDPFRHLLSDYYAMERSKDDRLYGVLTDVQISAPGRGVPDSRWTETLKPLLALLVNGEFAAMKTAAMLVDAVPNAELRQGYMAQTLDELRHVTLENQLLRYLAKSAPDPAGFNGAHRYRASNLLLRASRSLLEAFLSGDPITCALNLQVIVETAYTNPIFVANTEIAAANGDQLTPSTFLSIQSDEARHMANGYATMAAVLSVPENIPRAQEDLELCFWRQHAFLDPFLTLVYDYSSVERQRSYQEFWSEWVWEEWAGAYVDRLAPFGLLRPTSAEVACSDIRWRGHDVAELTAALWPLQFWRVDPLTDADFWWFEDKYPGWWNRHGTFWRNYAELSDPGGEGLVSALAELPLICRVCQMPCRTGPDGESEPRVLRDGAGRRHAFCSPFCESFYRAEPHRYQAMTWTELNHGVELSEYILREDLVRADGKTLIAQPHLDTDSARLWTVEDIARHGIEITDPLAAIPVEQVGELDGLPSATPAGGPR